jgi:hypothetical protein
MDDLQWQDAAAAAVESSLRRRRWLIDWPT